MSLAGATGLVGTAVGLAVLVGVTGLAFRAVDRAFDGDRGRGRSRRRSDDGLFGGTGIGEPSRKRSRSRSNDNIFDLGITQQSPRKTRGRKFRQDFGSDFNIFKI